MFAGGYIKPHYQEKWWHRIQYGGYFWGEGTGA